MLASLLYFTIVVGFTNPPANFTCQAFDQRLDVTKPSVFLSWDRPSLQAYSVGSDGFIEPPRRGSYMIVCEANGTNHSLTVDVENSTALIDLPGDSQYSCSVYYAHGEKERFPRTAIAKCQNNTFIRRSKMTSIRYAWFMSFVAPLQI